MQHLSADYSIELVHRAADRTNVSVGHLQFQRYEVSYRLDLSNLVPGRVELAWRIDGRVPAYDHRHGITVIEHPARNVRHFHRTEYHDVRSFSIEIRYDVTHSGYELAMLPAGEPDGSLGSSTGYRSCNNHRPPRP